MPGPTVVTRFPSPRAFLAAAETFLLEHEVENNLILGITADLAANPAGLIPNPYFAVVSEPAGVVMAAFQTLPGRVAITTARTPEAAAALAHDVHAAHLIVDAALGPDPTVELFAGELARLRDQQHQVYMRQRIHQLTAVSSLPAAPAGGLRLAVAKDIPLVTDWLEAFQQEIGEPAPTGRTARYRIEAKELFLWDDGEPRSMAGWSGPTAHGVRVNAVYTPPELRSGGYATATVAALSQVLLDRGFRFCCLYTDLSNSTSNAIYQRIGYTPVCDSSVYRLVRREA